MARAHLLVSSSAGHKGWLSKDSQGLGSDFVTVKMHYCKLRSSFQGMVCWPLAGRLWLGRRSEMPPGVAKHG